MNKVNSKATLRWHPGSSPSLPDSVKNRFLEQNATKLTTEGELVISSDRFRDQKMNTDDCINRLKDLLLKASVAPKARKKTKPSKGSQRRNETAKRTNKEKKQNRGRVKF